MMEVDEDSQHNYTHMQRAQADQAAREEQERQDLRAKMMLGSQMKT